MVLSFLDEILVGTLGEQEHSRNLYLGSRYWNLQRKRPHRNLLPVQ
jgi:hypothetical protein